MIVGDIDIVLSYVIHQNSVTDHRNQYQPIYPFPHASPRQSIPCYRTNEYYQPKRRFYCLLGIARENIFLNSWFPTHIDPAAFPHIKLTSNQPWNPHQIEFPSTKYYVKEEIEAQNVSSIGIKFHQSIEDDERQIVD